MKDKLPEGFSVTIDGQTFVLSGAVAKLIVLISRERDELKSEIVKLKDKQEN